MTESRMNELPAKGFVMASTAVTGSATAEVTKMESMNDVVGRLERLECQHRRLRAVAVVAVLMIGGGVLLGWAPRHQVLEEVVAQKFRLVDDGGTTRAELRLNPSFELDAFGEQTVVPSDPGFYMIDESGATRLYIGSETLILWENDESHAYLTKDAIRFSRAIGFSSEYED